MQASTSHLQQDSPATSDIATAALSLAAAEAAAASEIAALREHLAATGALPELAPVLARLGDIERIMAGQREDLADAAIMKSLGERFAVPARPRRHLAVVR